MTKIRAAIVGYGNIGKYALEAIEASEDMECVGIVRRNGEENKPAELANYKVVKNITELDEVQVAILATPTLLTYTQRLLTFAVRSTKWLRRTTLYL